MSRTTGIILVATLQLIIGSIHSSTKGTPAASRDMYNSNETSVAGIKIKFSTRVKYDGKYLTGNIVPLTSRVTLSCKVSFQRIPKNSFNIALIAFGLPNGGQMVPGNCIVTRNNFSKRCKMLIKKVTWLDQGIYRCLVYYVKKRKTMKHYKDMVLNIAPPKCPSSKMFCYKKKKCIDDITECNTKRKCSSSEFRCGDGDCIENQYLCDDIYDCLDKSDEAQCAQRHIHGICNKTESFACNTGECLPSNVRCNDKQDCRDNSDEMNCTTCPQGYVQCATGHNCFPISCDNVTEAVGSLRKRENCTSSKNSGCSTGKCIKVEEVCNGLEECKDGSDETHCDVNHLPQTMNYTNLHIKEKASITGYGLAVVGMLCLTILTIVFSLWIKRKRKNLENRILLAGNVHMFVALEKAVPRKFKRINFQM